MARHEELEKRTQLRVYFADPHSPWQRPTNENTNGLLRQYFPKGTNLSQYSQQYLTKVAEEIDNRTQKILWFSYVGRSNCAQYQRVKKQCCTSELKPPNHQIK
jgi:IS30 family transposase